MVIVFAKDVTSRPLLYLVLALLCVNLGVTAARADQSVDADVVHYSLSPRISAVGIRSLSVEMRFDADASGRTILNLPDDWADRHDLWVNLSAFAAEGGTIEASEDPSQLVITSAPGADLTVRYEVGSGLTNLPSIDDAQPTVPWIFADWFYANGETVFAVPRGRLSSSATFDWKGPAEMAFVSDLAHLDSGEKVGVRPGTVRDIRRSTILGGDDVRSVDIGETTVGIHGRFVFSDQELADTVSRVMAAENRFWGDDGKAPMTVTLASISADAGISGYAGNGKDDGFSLAATGGTTLEELRWFLAHEAFHAWNPRVLGRRAQQVDDHASDTWFVEGFTDFFARQVLLLSDIFSPEEFAGSWNDILLEYANNTVPTPDAGGHITLPADPSQSEQLDYQRGAMIAAILDRELKEKSSGRSDLGDVLRRQRDMASANPTATAVELFFQAATSFRIDAKTKIDRLLLEDSKLSLPSDVFGACYHVLSVTQPSFDRGFDSDATMKADMVVAGVNNSGPAYRAGLRNGMKLMRLVAGRVGDSETRYTVSVASGAGESLISYMPIGVGSISLQRVEVVPSCR